MFKSPVVLPSLAFIALLLFSALPSLACYSGLVIIPTAETVGADTLSLDLQVDGSFARQTGDTKIINTEFGLGSRWEAGVDYDASDGADSRWFGNAKYLALEDRATAPALALGITNVGRHITAVPYAVASHDFSVVQGHLGWGRFESKDRWFAGVDKDLNEKLSIMADYTSGDDNASSIGLNYDLGHCWSVCLGAMYPNGGGETGFSCHLAWEIPYRQSPSEEN
jgi:hypothetical protein